MSVCLHSCLNFPACKARHIILSFVFFLAGIDQISAELIKAGGRTICLEIHKLITSIWKKEKLSEEWKESIIVPIHKKGDKTDCSNYRGM